jgi:hypothetical protein
MFGMFRVVGTEVSEGGVINFQILRLVGARRKAHGDMELVVFELKKLLVS